MTKIFNNFEEAINEVQTTWRNYSDNLEKDLLEQIAKRDDKIAELERWLEGLLEIRRQDILDSTLELAVGLCKSVAII